MSIGRFGLLVALVVAACAAPPSPGGYTSSGLPPVVPAWRELPSELSMAGPKPAEAPSLVGLASRDIEVLFGRPRFVRRDGPAQIWQYGTDACTMNLFFYRDGAAYKVRHVEMRDRSADLTSAGSCNGAAVSMVQKAP